MTSIIAWDLDGTIIDTYHLMKETYNSILGPDFCADLSASPWKNIKSAGLNPKSTIARFWEKYRQNVPHLAEVYSNIINVLQVIKQKGISQVIISSLPDKIVESLLFHIEITDIFDIIIGGSKREFMKPRPTSIEFCLKQLHGTKNRFIMIGDSDKDQQLARNAEVHFIAAKWNHRCKLQSHYGCKSSTDILKIIDGILDSAVSIG